MVVRDGFGVHGWGSPASGMGLDVPRSPLLCYLLRGMVVKKHSIGACWDLVAERANVALSHSASAVPALHLVLIATLLKGAGSQKGCRRKTSRVFQWVENLPYCCGGLKKLGLLSLSKAG